MDTIDRLRLPDVYLGGVVLQIGDGWVVRLKTGAASENDSWLLIQGEGQNLAFRANTRVYLCLRGTKPPIYVAPPPP